VRIKVDENIGKSGVNLLRLSGHDVMTVRDEGLAGSPDEKLFQACLAEGRTLITLDRDFGQAPRFPPKQTAGIVILELGGAASLRLLNDRIRDFLALSENRSISGELWIVEPGRVRVRLDKDDE
jgi:predicted nuclease of predicted toxin-antitoxin system